PPPQPPPMLAIALSPIPRLESLAPTPYNPPYRHSPDIKPSMLSIALVPYSKAKITGSNPVQPTV
ncbi:hypothetical protein, partial [Pseudoalteromonas ruthenica]|uniref:hypothetical protein n=1 Tax=Pseudoalteromonas ruthenica TaxID=151081 RepID=UPI001BB1B077